MQAPPQSARPSRTPSKRVRAKVQTQKEAARKAKEAAKAAETKLASLRSRAAYLDQVLTDPSLAKRGSLKKKLASPAGAAKVRDEYEFILGKIAELDPTEVVPPVAPLLCVHCGTVVHDSAAAAAECATVQLRRLHGGVSGRCTTAEDSRYYMFMFNLVQQDHMDWDFKKVCARVAANCQAAPLTVENSVRDWMDDGELRVVDSAEAHSRGVAFVVEDAHVFYLKLLCSNHKRDGRMGMCTRHALMEDMVKKFSALKGAGRAFFEECARRADLVYCKVSHDYTANLNTPRRRLQKELYLLAMNHAIQKEKEGKAVIVHFDEVRFFSPPLSFPFSPLRLQACSVTPTSARFSPSRPNSFHILLQSYLDWLSHITRGWVDKGAPWANIPSGKGNREVIMCCMTRHGALCDVVVKKVDRKVVLNVTFKTHSMDNASAAQAEKEPLHGQNDTTLVLFELDRSEGNDYHVTGALIIDYLKRIIGNTCAKLYPGLDVYLSWDGASTHYGGTGAQPVAALAASRSKGNAKGQRGRAYALARAATAAATAAQNAAAAAANAARLVSAAATAGSGAAAGGAVSAADASKPLNRHMAKPVIVAFLLRCMRERVADLNLNAADAKNFEFKAAVGKTGEKMVTLDARDIDGTERAKKGADIPDKDQLFDAALAWAKRFRRRALLSDFEKFGLSEWRGGGGAAAPPLPPPPAKRRRRDADAAPPPPPLPPPREPQIRFIYTVPKAPNAIAIEFMWAQWKDRFRRLYSSRDKNMKEAEVIKRLCVQIAADSLRLTLFTRAQIAPHLLHVTSHSIPRLLAGARPSSPRAGRAPSLARSPTMSASTRRRRR